SRAHTSAAALWRPSATSQTPSKAPKVAPTAPSTDPAPPSAEPQPCDTDTHYVNKKGSCLLRPVPGPVGPPGATARCKAGTYSSSQSRSGTCSRHGGVKEW